MSGFFYTGIAKMCPRLPETTRIVSVSGMHRHGAATYDHLMLSTNSWALTIAVLEISVCVVLAVEGVLDLEHPKRVRIVNLTLAISLLRDLLVLLVLKGLQSVQALALYLPGETSIVIAAERQGLSAAFKVHKLPLVLANLVAANAVRSVACTMISDALPPRRPSALLHLASMAGPGQKIMSIYSNAHVTHKGFHQKVDTY